MSTVLVTDFVILLLIFIRILSAFVSAPVFNNSAFPAIAKIFLAFVIAYVIFSLVDKSKIVIEFNTWFLLSNVFKEVITGLLLGFTLNMVFYGLTFAGSIMGFDIGLASAQLLNPFDETNSEVIGNILYFLGMLIFLLINGHHYLIRALYSSFSIVPLGKYTINQPVYDLLLKYTSSVFVIAIKIAAPVLVSFFLIHIAEGIISRVIPQMQVFFVTQPLKIGLGIILIIIALPTYLGHFFALYINQESSQFI